MSFSVRHTAELSSILDAFKGKRIVVVGDVILDEYLWGKVSRISPEAPVPVVELTEREHMPGGAAYVASLISSMDAACEIIGVVGRDDRGVELKRLLVKLRVNVEGLVVDPDRPTTFKSRVMAQRQQVVRVDQEVTTPVGDRVADRLTRIAAGKISRADAVIVSDYAKGVIIPKVFQRIIREARRRALPVTVDPKPAYCLRYRGVTAITPNTLEAATATGVRIESERSLAKAGNMLLHALKSACVLITRGEQGMSLFEKGRRGITHIPTTAREVFDVSGAGDTVISTFTLALAAGATLLQAAELANIAAGVQVGKLGTARITRKEIRHSMHVVHPS